MSRQYSRNSILALLALLLIAASSDRGAAGGAKREPIVITASHMEADQLGDTVTFTGDVTLKKEAMTLTSDALTVFYDARNKGVKEIEASGNVTVRKEGRVALANKARYYSREEKIVLTGDARIIEGENQLGGDRITLFVRDDRSIVEGGNVLFYQDVVEEEKGKGAKSQRPRSK